MFCTVVSLQNRSYAFRAEADKGRYVVRSGMLTSVKDKERLQVLLYALLHVKAYNPINGTV